MTDMSPEVVLQTAEDSTRGRPLDRLQRRQGAYLVGGVMVAFFAYGLQFAGPAYLSDEVGYLTKAAIIAGSAMTYSTSWYGGYSFLISPAYAVTSDGFLAFRLVLAVNAVLWGVSAGLLIRLAEAWFPDKDVRIRLGAVVIAIIYPSWIVISGYAFASSAFIATFLLAVWLLQTADSVSRFSTFFLVVGYLSWIHPLGVPVAVVLAVAASTLLLTVSPPGAVRHLRILLAFAGPIVTLGLSAFYQLLVHPWLAPTGGHYPDEASQAVIGRLVRMFDAYPMTLLSVASRLNYLLVATLGIAAFGFWHMGISVTRQVMTWRESKVDRTSIVFGAVLFSFLSVLLVTGLSVGGRIDTPIYGRYLEMVFLPILLVGLLARKHAAGMLVSLGVVLASGLGLDRFHSGSYNNQVNVTAYWPQVFAPESGYLVWALIGAAGIFAGFVLARHVWFALLGVFVLSVGFSTAFHQEILAQYSQPPSLIRAIYATVPPGGCIGLDIPNSAAGLRERNNLLQTFLYAYDVRRVAAADWFDECDGPLLHYEPLPRDERSLVLVARHDASGILMTVKPDSDLRALVDALRDDVTSVSSVDAGCLADGCLARLRFDTTDHSQIGHLADDGALETTGREGYLVFGQYALLGAGYREVELEIDVKDGRGVVVDVVSARGASVHTTYKLDGSSGLQKIRLPFRLHQRVHDLEVRVFVSAASEVRLRSILVGPSSPPTLCQVHGCFVRKAFSLGDPSQVGRLTPGGSLETDGVAGYLIYGPYESFGPGLRVLELELDITQGGGAFVDVVSDSGRTVRASLALDEFTGFQRLVVPFYLGQAVHDLEMRVFVAETSDLKLKKLSVGPVGAVVP